MAQLGLVPNLLKGIRSFFTKETQEEKIQREAKALALAEIFREQRLLDIAQGEQRGQKRGRTPRTRNVALMKRRAAAVVLFTLFYNLESVVLEHDATPGKAVTASVRGPYGKWSQFHKAHVLEKFAKLGNRAAIVRELK